MSNKFDPRALQVSLVEEIAKLDPYSLGLFPSPDSMEGRGTYIEALCKLVANHVERLAADADASCSGGNIGEEDARVISDIGAEIGGRIQLAAERLPVNVGRSAFAEHNTLNRAQQGV